MENFHSIAFDTSFSERRVDKLSASIRSVDCIGMTDPPHSLGLEELIISVRYPKSRLKAHREYQCSNN
jgi:hypothetical protein